MSAALDNGICAEYLNENSDRMKKLREHKNKITSLLNEIHELWVFLPEKLVEYATEYERPMFGNPLWLIDPIEKTAVTEHLEGEALAIRMFASKMEGGYFKTQWIYATSEVVQLIATILRELSKMISKFNSIVINHIRKAINSNAVIIKMPIVKGFSEDFDAFDADCSSYVISLNPDKLIAKFVEDLFKPKKSVIQQFDVTETNKLDKIVGKAKGLINEEKAKIVRSG